MAEYNITPERAEAVWEKVGGDNRVDMLLDGFLIVRQKRKSIFKRVEGYSISMDVPACSNFNLNDFLQNEKFRVSPNFFNCPNRES